MPEGFYFRHDSNKNPFYEMQLELQEKKLGKDKEEAARVLMVKDAESKILEKMKF